LVERVRLRAATEADRDFFFSVRRDGLREYAEAHWPWDEEAQRRQADLEFDELPVQIIELDGTAVGYLCVLHEPDHDFLDEIVLVPSAQRRGIGTTLVRAAMKEARCRNVPLRLSVLVNNPARRLYERLGFGVSSVEHSRVRMEWPHAIRTERLVLRPLAADDVDLLFELDADPAVMRYITGGKPTHRAEVEETVRASAGHRWAAFQGEHFVGWFALDPTDGDPADRELGYRLRRDAWGRGLASEGARALVDVAFRELGARRVWAQTMTVNERSRRVLERCGLRYARTFHADWPEAIEGTELGDVEYELLREEWLASTSWNSG
jgi:RimJ/RimL family protein N-acetyltransferase